MSTRYLVVLVDRQNGQLYAYEPQNHLEHLEAVTDVVPKAVKGGSWKGLADDKIDRHVDEHVREHYKHVIERMERALVSDDVRILVGAHEETQSEFLELLPNPLKERVVAHFVYNPHENVKDLEERVVTAAAEAADHELQRIVSQIEESRQPTGRGVVGHEALYEALSLKQLQTLLVDQSAALPGYWCEQDGYISELVSTCPSCRANLTQHESLHVAIKALAQSQAAQLIIVNDPALLASYQGLAGLKRYS